MTSVHPVHFRVEPTSRFARVHVVIRLALLLAIGAVGFSSLYWLLYLALPALAAIIVMQKGGNRYLAEDAPRAVPVLRWVAGAYAYLWLLTDALPTAQAGGAVELEIETGGRPSATSSLARLLSSLPALLVSVVLSLVAAPLWIAGAVVVLVRQQMPAPIADFLSLTLRYQVRLIAYHASLVERYPALDESGPVHAPV